MSYIFKPRRGNITTMASSSTVLSTGEMFLEYPSDGVGKGDSNIKIGDGSAAYSSLPYAIGSQAPVTFTATTETDNSTLLDTIISGASSATMFGAIKNLLTNLNSSISTLEENYSSIEEGISCVAQYGYAYLETSTTIASKGYTSCSVDCSTIYIPTTTTTTTTVSLDTSQALPMGAQCSVATNVFKNPIVAYLWSAAAFGSSTKVTDYTTITVQMINPTTSSITIDGVYIAFLIWSVS